MAKRRIWLDIQLNAGAEEKFPAMEEGGQVKFADALAKAFTAKVEAFYAHA